MGFRRVCDLAAHPCGAAWWREHAAGHITGRRQGPARRSPLPPVSALRCASASTTCHNIALACARVMRPGVRSSDGPKFITMPHQSSTAQTYQTGNSRRPRGTPLGDPRPRLIAAQSWRPGFRERERERVICPHVKLRLVRARRDLCEALEIACPASRSSPPFLSREYPGRHHRRRRLSIRTGRSPPPFAVCARWSTTRADQPDPLASRHQRCHSRGIDPRFTGRPHWDPRRHRNARRAPSGSRPPASGFV